MKKIVNPQSQMRGYSIVELLIALALISIFSAMAVPSMVRTYRSYQMDDAASQVAAQLKFTRYEAIRRNNAINCLNKPQNGVLTMFTDNVAAGGSSTNGTITFDGRGAKTAPAGPSVYWVGNAVYGWRAVTVLPAGSVQVWSNATGTWQQLS